MNPEAKPLFERACKTLDISPEARAAAWRAIADLQLDPDDPTVILLATGQAFSEGTRKMLAQLEALPGEIEMQALRAVAGMTTSLQDDLVDTARAEMRAALQAQRLDQHKMIRSELQQRLAGVVASMVFAVVLIIAIAGTFGYAFGRSDTRGLADDMARAATSASAGDWLQIIRQNPGFEIAKDCSPNSGAAFEAMDGSTGCNLRIEKDPPPRSRGERFLAQLRRQQIWSGPLIAAVIGAWAGFALRVRSRKEAPQ